MSLLRESLIILFCDLSDEPTRIEFFPNRRHRYGHLQSLRRQLRPVLLHFIGDPAELGRGLLFLSDHRVRSWSPYVELASLPTISLLSVSTIGITPVRTLPGELRQKLRFDEVATFEPQEVEA